MDEINRFRQSFFDKVIESEKKKEQEERLLQTNCFHLYKIVMDTYKNRGITYQYRTCSKCGHSTVRRREVWEGSKGCTLS